MRFVLGATARDAFTGLKFVMRTPGLLPAKFITWVSRKSAMMTCPLCTPSDSGSKVTLTDVAGAAVDFVRTGDKLLPATLPEGKAPDEGKANRVTAFLQGFDFTDVRKETPASIGNTTRLRYETSDGLAVTATAVPATDDAGKGWIRLTAEAIDPKAADAAKAINDRTAGYEFKVNTIHTEMFGWTVESLAKDG